MIAIIDYQMGNLQSVANAMEALGEKFLIADKPEYLSKSDAIIIPGVGAFKDGMENLKKAKFIDALEKEIMINKKPFLGICLGMQLIAQKSFEGGEYKGLGWIDFTVKKIIPGNSSFKVPHMGWNDLKIKGDGGALFKEVREPAVVYFVHSYNLEPEPGAEKQITSTSFHGQTITASIEKDNIFGTQFHPEKSQNTGLTILKNFIDITKNA